MAKNMYIKPSKSAAVGQMIVATIFTFIGLLVVIPAISKAGGPVWFGILWTGIAATGAIRGAINAFSDHGIPTREIVSDAQEAPPIRSTEERLRKLDDLLQKKLISETEYNDTRKRILDEH